jgi:hypothetical protein
MKRAEEFEREAQENSASAEGNKGTPPLYRLKGGSPVHYLKQGVNKDDILLGDGFLERGSIFLVVGPSGVGKSSLAMQAGCYWSCGEPAFDLKPPRDLRVVMIQSEDSDNDLARQSIILNHLELDRAKIESNFWIEPLRGKTGQAAMDAVRSILEQRERTDLLITNPLSAYHGGDIVQNKDNALFFYGQLIPLLDEFKIAALPLHHKGKPKKQTGAKPQEIEDLLSEVMYDLLGGSVITNAARGILIISPIKNLKKFKFIIAKRFPESGWETQTQYWKWHDDKEVRLWVPCSAVEADQAKNTSSKTIEELYKLLPVDRTVHRNQLYLTAKSAGFKRDEFRGLLAEALRDDTPDEHRIHEWSIYNPRGAPTVHYSRTSQPEDQKPEFVKARREEATRAKEIAETDTGA